MKFESFKRNVCFCFRFCSESLEISILKETFLIQQVVKRAQRAFKSYASYLADDKSQLHVSSVSILYDESTTCLFDQHFTLTVGPSLVSHNYGKPLYYCREYTRRLSSLGSGEKVLRKFSSTGVFSPDPTDCPWVSKNDSSSETWRKSYVKQVPIIVLFLLTMPACYSQSILQKTVSTLVNQITNS